MPDQYRPPFTVTPTAIRLVGEIAEIVGRLSVLHESPFAMRLRRANRIRTIQGSLAIEGNTLSTDQITAILEGKRVLAPSSEIQEARNAIEAYEHLADWNPVGETDLLAAQGVLMRGLVDAPGKYRIGGVGVMRGQEVVHLAPPAESVHALIKDLLAWLKREDHHPLIASSVFHYEFEFIHPFPDGNGRMGRLWQTLILTRWNPVMAFIPVETLVHRNQAQYYAALNQSSATADSGVFLDFMLTMIRDAVHEVASVTEKTPEKTPEKLLRILVDNPNTTIAQLVALTGLSPRTVERSLSRLQTEGRVRRVGPDKGGHWEVIE